MLEEYIKVYAKNAGFPEDFLPEICDASKDGGIYSINFAGIFVSLIPCTFEDKSYVKAVIAVKEIKDEDLCEVFNLQRKIKFLRLPVRPELYIESKEKILSILVFLPLDDLKETAFLNFMDALESLALFTANGKAVYQNYRDLDLKKNHAKLLNFLSAAGVNYYDLRANFMRLPTSEGSTLVGLDAASCQITLKNLVKEHVSFNEALETLALNNEFCGKHVVSLNSSGSLFISTVISINDEKPEAFKDSVAKQLKLSYELEKVLSEDFSEVKEQTTYSSDDLLHNFQNFLGA